MGPSALSAGIFESGMYYYVLCRIRKSPLSRIWTHLVRLAGTRRICIHLLWKEGFGSRAYTAMYYVTAKICCFRASGPISCAWPEPAGYASTCFGRRDLEAGHIRPCTMLQPKSAAFAHLDPSRAPGRNPQDMHPPALEGGIWKPGIYGHVLCYSQNLLLSRIWLHLPRLERVGAICFTGSKFNSVFTKSKPSTIIK